MGGVIVQRPRVDPTTVTPRPVEQIARAVQETTRLAEGVRSLEALRKAKLAQAANLVASKKKMVEEKLAAQLLQKQSILAAYNKTKALKKAVAPPVPVQALRPKNVIVQAEKALAARSANVEAAAKQKIAAAINRVHEAGDLLQSAAGLHHSSQADAIRAERDGIVVSAERPLNQATLHQSAHDGTLARHVVRQFDSIIGDTRSPDSTGIKDALTRLIEDLKTTGDIHDGLVTQEQVAAVHSWVVSQLAASAGREIIRAREASPTLEDIGVQAWYRDAASSSSLKAEAKAAVERVNAGLATSDTVKLSGKIAEITYIFRMAKVKLKEYADRARKQGTDTTDFLQNLENGARTDITHAQADLAAHEAIPPPPPGAPPPGIGRGVVADLRSRVAAAETSRRTAEQERNDARAAAEATQSALGGLLIEAGRDRAFEALKAAADALAEHVRIKSLKATLDVDGAMREFLAAKQGAAGAHMLAESMRPKPPPRPPVSYNRPSIEKINALRQRAIEAEAKAAAAAADAANNHGAATALEPIDVPPPPRFDPSRFDPAKDFWGNLHANLGKYKKEIATQHASALKKETWRAGIKAYLEAKAISERAPGIHPKETITAVAPQAVAARQHATDAAGDGALGIHSLDDINLADHPGKVAEARGAEGGIREAAGRALDAATVDPRPVTEVVGRLDTTAAALGLESNKVRNGDPARQAVKEALAATIKAAENAKAADDMCRELNRQIAAAKSKIIQGNKPSDIGNVEQQLTQINMGDGPAMDAIAALEAKYQKALSEVGKAQQHLQETFNTATQLMQHNRESCNALQQGVTDALTKVNRKKITYLDIWGNIIDGLTRITSALSIKVDVRLYVDRFGVGINTSIDVMSSFLGRPRYGLYVINIFRNKPLEKRDNSNRGRINHALEANYLFGKEKDVRQDIIGAQDNLRNWRDHPPSDIFNEVPNIDKVLQRALNDLQDGKNGKNKAATELTQFTDNVRITRGLIDANGYDIIKKKREVDDAIKAINDAYSAYTRAKEDHIREEGNIENLTRELGILEGKLKNASEFAEKHRPSTSDKAVRRRESEIIAEINRLKDKINDARNNLGRKHNNIDGPGGLLEKLYDTIRRLDEHIKNEPNWTSLNEHIQSMVLKLGGDRGKYNKHSKDVGGELRKEYKDERIKDALMENLMAVIRAKEIQNGPGGIHPRNDNPGTLGVKQTDIHRKISDEADAEVGERYDHNRMSDTIDGIRKEIGKHDAIRDEDGRVKKEIPIEEGNLGDLNRKRSDAERALEVDDAGAKNAGRRAGENSDNAARINREFPEMNGRVEAFKAVLTELKRRARRGTDDSAEFYNKKRKEQDDGRKARKMDSDDADIKRRRSKNDADADAAREQAEKDAHKIAQDELDAFKREHPDERIGDSELAIDGKRLRDSMDETVRLKKEAADARAAREATEAELARNEAERIAKEAEEAAAKEAEEAAAKKARDDAENARKENENIDKLKQEFEDLKAKAKKAKEDAKECMPEHFRDREAALKRKGELEELIKKKKKELDDAIKKRDDDEARKKEPREDLDARIKEEEARKKGLSDEEEELNRRSREEEERLADIDARIKRLQKWLSILSKMFDWLTFLYIILWMVLPLAPPVQPVDPGIDIIDSSNSGTSGPEAPGAASGATDEPPPDVSGAVPPTPPVLPNVACKQGSSDYLRGCKDGIQRGTKDGKTDGTKDEKAHAAKILPYTNGEIDTYVDINIAQFLPIEQAAYCARIKEDSTIAGLDMAAISKLYPQCKFGDVPVSDYGYGDYGYGYGDYGYGDYGYGEIQYGGATDITTLLSQSSDYLLGWTSGYDTAYNMAYQTAWSLAKLGNPIPIHRVPYTDGYGDYGYGDYGYGYGYGYGDGYDYGKGKKQKMAIKGLQKQLQNGGSRGLKAQLKRIIDKTSQQ